MLQSVKGEITIEKREAALKGRKGFKIMVDEVYSISGNWCDFKEVRELGGSLFLYEDGVERTDREHKAFRKLYQGPYICVRIMDRASGVERRFERRLQHRLLE